MVASMAARASSVRCGKATGEVACGAAWKGLRMIVIGLLSVALGAALPDEAGLVIVAGADPSAECYRAARAGAASDAAIAVCTRAVEGAAYPINRTASRVNRGVIHYNAAMYDAAIADFTAVIDGGAKMARVYVNRGLAYEQRGVGDARYDALAAADYRQALRSQPKNPLAKRRLGELAKPPRERTPLARRVVA